MAGKRDQGGIVLKRKELMMSLQLCICCRVQVVKIIPLIKIQEKIIGIPSKKIQKKLTSQAGPFNLLECMHASLGVNWASQDIAGVCRSLRY